MKIRVDLEGDYAGWPLWGPSRPDDWPTLSDAVKRDLIAWNDDYCSPARESRLPWRRRRQEREYIAASHALAVRVQAELGDQYDVRWSG